MNPSFWLALIEALVPVFVSAINAIGSVRGDKPIPASMVPVIAGAMKDAEKEGGSGEKKKGDVFAQLAPTILQAGVNPVAISKVIDGVISAANKSAALALEHAQHAS